MFSTKTPSIQGREEEKTAGGFSKFCPEFSREKEKKKKKRKGEKKEEKEKKGRRSWYTLQQGRFFSYLGHSLPRGHSMAMELSPNLGAGSAQFGTNCGRVF